VVIAVVLQAFWNLAHSAVKTPLLGAIGVGSVIALLFGADNLIVLVCAGILAAAPKVYKKLIRRDAVAALISWKPSAAVGLLMAASGASAPPITLWRLFLAFLKIGSVLFGSGYVLLAFLRSDFVVRLHWLTEKQVLDAVAVGQVTPGPVFTTATFIGYLLGGLPGAAVATVAIFLPGFLLVAASGPLIPKIRRSPVAGAILDGVIVGSLALMGVVTWQLGRAALIDPLTITIASLSAVLLFAFRINAAWLVLVAAVVGIIHRT
jgi:chromate transporter